jgi:hypothetical protein
VDQCLLKLLSCSSKPYQYQKRNTYYRQSHPGGQMKFLKLVATLSVLLSCMLLKADIVETTQDTGQINIPLAGDEVGAVTTGGLVINRHGQSTTPPSPPSIPEPASALLLGVSLIGAAMISRRRKAAQV